MPDYSLDYSKYRITKSREDLESAKYLYNIKAYSAANNRAYYCVFHAVRSVLALDNFDSKKHSGVISKFRENYIKTGILPIDISDAIKETFEVRQDSDYGDMYEATAEETAEQIKNAEYVYNTIKAYLSARIYNDIVARLREQHPDWSDQEITEEAKALIGVL